MKPIYEPKDNGKYIKLNPPKIYRDEITSSYHFESKFLAKIYGMADKTIYGAIIEYAKEQGITDLILMDEEFIKSALIHEMELRSPAQQCKEIKKPKTNFDKITQNEESLAEFLSKTMMCDDCPIRLQSNTCKCSVSSPCSQIIKEWLQKECE